MKFCSNCILNINQCESVLYPRKMATSGELSEIISQRGKILLVLNQFKYKEENRKLSSGETKWRCIKTGCNACLKTIGDSSGRVLTWSNQNHSHEQEPEHLLQRQILTQAAKRKAESDLTEKPAKIMRKALAKDNNTNALTVRDLECVRKNIYYARRKSLPAVPRSIMEVHTALDIMNLKTSSSEEFLLVNDKTMNLVIFSCNSNLSYLCKSQILYMDGTFSYCTKFFKQFFTIHGFINGHYIPLVFCLLKDKSEETYKLCLSKILELCSRIKLVLSPTEVVVDYEIAIHNAVLQVWNDIKITGCRFHLAQAWYRQIQKLGLTQHYKDNKSEVGKWLHYCFGLVFLKPNDVEDFYFFELYEIKPQNTNLEKFSDYLLNTYLTNESKFPPHIWASASAALNKTTNACESFHAHFNNSMYQTHPSIFIFIQELLNVQAETYVKCNSVSSIHRSRNLAIKKKQEFIEDKIKKYNDKEISKLSYVKMVSYYHSR